MKLSLKHIYICSLIGLGASTLASCNDFLDREPITNVTPEAYFTTVDQVGAYVINYYSYLQNSRQQSLYHDKNWRSGMTLNDNNTFISIQNCICFILRYIDGSIHRYCIGISWLIRLTISQ